MKVLQVTERYLDHEIGGAQKSVQLLAEGLARRGMQVVVCAVHESPVLDLQKVNGVRVYKLPLGNRDRRLRNAHLGPMRALRDHLAESFQVGSSPELSFVLEREKPDIVHSNILSGFSVSLWRTAARHNCKVVHTVRDHYLRCARSTMYKHGAKCRSVCTECRILSLPKRVETKRVDAVVGISRKLLDEQLKAGYFPAARISRVIPNSIGQLRGAIPLTRSLPRTPVTLGFIGRLVAAKGIELLLRELRHLDDKFRLLVAGTGNTAYVRRLHAIAGDNVTFLGKCEADAFYEKIDLLVVPSLWDEPFGRVVIEAFSFGLPVIASNRGALPELVLPAAAGAIFDPDTPGSLANSIQHLTCDPVTYSRFSKVALQAAPRYSDDSVTDAYEDLYQELQGANKNQDLCFPLS
ncbi:MAG: glycosyltransferase family 4 protein [Chthoniobacterales bacterium]|nr:glycosyltransferase family 4 protein [Chthoniobacterales bacterium]